MLVYILVRRSLYAGMSVVVVVVVVCLTVSLWQVRRGVEVGPAHVVPVSLGADASLLGPLVAGRDTRNGGRGPVGAQDGRVLIHDAAERPAGAGVLRRRPGRDRKQEEIPVRQGGWVIIYPSW